VAVDATPHFLSRTLIMALLVGSSYPGNIVTTPEAVNAATCQVIAHHVTKGDGDHDQHMTRKQKTIRDLMLAGF